MSQENIYIKLARVRKLVEALKKNKQVGHQTYGYKYVTEDEILAKVTAGMEKQGLSLVPNIMHNSTIVSPYQYSKTKATKSGDVYEEKVNEVLVQSDMEWVWVNNENPDERVVVPWILVGHQANASMAFGSGLSYTVRYFLLKYFNVSTLEDDVDAWSAKQREAIDKGDAEVAAVLAKEIEMLAKTYAKKTGDKETLATELKKIIKTKSGNPSANPHDITTIEMANVVKAKLENMLEKLGTEVT